MTSITGRSIAHKLKLKIIHYLHFMYSRQVTIHLSSKSLLQILVAKMSTTFNILFHSPLLIKSFAFLANNLDASIKAPNYLNTIIS